MERKCPKCGGKLGIFDLKPNCPHCGCSIMYYDMDKRLEEDSVKAEAEARNDPRQDNSRIHQEKESRERRKREKRKGFK